MLEIRHLRTLSALRSAGSLVRAARLLRLADTLLPEIELAEREVARLSQGDQGQLRVALECHTCFDWLMPVMDEFRRRWPAVEIDLVSGFHSEPADLLRSGGADLVIGSSCSPEFVNFPLFRFETLVVMAQKHKLQGLRRLAAADFDGETLITYPVAEARVDLIREVLRPAGIAFERRTAELTVAILQLVASRRGVAALPNWAIKNYVDYDYVIAKPVGEHGLWSELVVSVPEPLGQKAYVRDFVHVIREQCAASLDGIKLLS